MRWKERQCGENRQGARGQGQGDKAGDGPCRGSKRNLFGPHFSSFRLQLSFRSKNHLLCSLITKAGSRGSRFGTGLTGPWG